MEYAAFIITYERPAIVVDTVRKLLNQTLPPIYILIVDNSSTRCTQTAIGQLGNEMIGYFSTGYNSGAAGGAYFGLSKLEAKGYDWILWVDDDDPPPDDTIMERLIRSTQAIRSAEKVGVIGVAGSDFNFKKAELRRFSNQELLDNQFLSVKCIAGGQFPLINSEVVRLGALPNKDFFFSFEDLDFCLKVHSLGYKMIVPSEIMIRRRHEIGRWDYSKPNKSSLPATGKEKLWREYYSVRNMTFLFTHQYVKISVVGYYLAKYLIKIIVAYSKGLSFGWSTTKYTIMGLAHGMMGKLGLTVKPVSKN